MQSHATHCTPVSVPGVPTAMVSSASTSIFLSWSMPSGSMVERYEIVWQRVTSRECPDEGVGTVTITDGRTSYNIEGLEEGSNYSIVVIAINAAGSAVSHPVTRKTGETGEELTNTI